MGNKKILLVFTLLVPAITSVHAANADYLWNGTADSSWANAANWTPLQGSGSGYPNDLTDEAEFQSNSIPQGSVLIPGGGISLETLSFNESPGVNTTFTIAGGPLTFGNSGSVQLENGSNPFTLIFSNPIVISSGTTLDVQLNGLQPLSVVLSGGISGAGGLSTNVSPSGIASAVTITGASTYSGTTAVTEGTLIISSTGTLPSNGVVQIDAGASLVLRNPAAIGTGNSLTVNGTLDLSATDITINGLPGVGTVTNSGSGTAGLTITTPVGFIEANFSGNISDGSSAIGVTINGGATPQIFAGVNTYSGGTSLRSGTFGVQGSSPLGVGALTMSGGTTLQAEGGTTLSNAVILPGSATATLDSHGNTLSISGPISGGASGTLAKVGSGTLVLSGSNSYSAGTSLNAGTIQVASTTTPLGSGTFTFNTGGTILQSGITGISLANPIALSAQGTIDTNGNLLTLTGTGAISGVSGLTVTGIGGTLSLPNSNSGYSGNILLNSGTISVGNNTSIGSGSLTFNGSSSVLESGAINLSVANSITLTTQGIVNTNGNTFALTGAISGTQSLVIQGGGTLSLPNANNDYSGATTLTSGVVAIGNNSSLGANSITFNGTGTTLRSMAASGLSITNPLTFTSQGIIDTNGHIFTSTGLITGAGGLEIIGVGGTLTIPNANNGYTGPTSLVNGTLSIGNGASLGSGMLTMGSATTLLPSASLTLANSITLPASGNATINTQANTIALTGQITAGSSGTFMKSGTGTLVLSGANNYAANTDLMDGTIQVSNASTPLGSGSLTFGAAGTILQSGMNGISLSNPIVMNFDGTIDPNGNTLTLTGPLTGTGILTIQGTAGKLVFPNFNSGYSGDIELMDGTLSIGNADSLGSGSLTMSNATAFTPTATMTLSNPIDLLSGNQTISPSTGTTTTLTSNFTGASGNLQIGSGTLNIQSNGNTADTVTIAPSATLMGTGTITATTMTVQGTTSPGNSPGIMTFYGDWIQASGSDYIASIVPAPADAVSPLTYPYTNVLNILGGNLQIDPNATLTLDPATGTYNPATYELITSADPISGQFANFTTLSPFLSGTLSYTQNQVLLTLIFTELLNDKSYSRNGNLVADALGQVFQAGNPELDLIFDSLVFLSESDQAYAVDQMHPAQLKAMTLIQENNSVAVSSGLSQRLQVVLDTEYAYSFNKKKNPKVPMKSAALRTHAEEIEDLILEQIATVEEVKETTPYAAKSTESIADANQSQFIEQESSTRTLMSGVENGLIIGLPLDETQEPKADFVAVEKLTLTTKEGTPEVTIETAQEPSEKTEVVIVNDCKKVKKPFHIWASGIGDYLKQSGLRFAGSPQVAYSAQTGGFVGGADYNFFDHYYVGALGAYTHSDISWKQNHGDGDIDTGYAGVYLSGIGHMFYGNLSAIGGWSGYSADRKIVYTGVNRTASNTHNGQQLIAHLDTGINLGIGGFAIRPFDAFDFIYQHENAFSETGAGEYNLAVQKSHASMLRNELGINLTTCGCFSWGKLTINRKVSWVRETRVSGENFTSQFIAADASFQSFGFFPNRNLLSVGANLTVLAFQEKVTGTIYYNGVFGTKYADNGFGGQLNYGF